MFFYYYIIFLPLFDFQRGYGTAERSEFILTEVKRIIQFKRSVEIYFIFKLSEK